MTRPTNVLKTTFLCWKITHPELHVIWNFWIHKPQRWITGSLVGTAPRSLDNTEPTTYHTMLEDIYALNYPPDYEVSATNFNQGTSTLPRGLCQPDYKYYRLTIKNMYM